MTTTTSNPEPDEWRLEGDEENRAYEKEYPQDADDPIKDPHRP